MNAIRLAFLLATVFIVTFLPSSVRAQNGRITYERYDVDITVATDGTFRVRETQQIRFDGEFSTAFAEIPLAYTETITDVIVYEGESAYEASPVANRPGTYSWDNTGANIVVEWSYEETGPGSVKTFVLEYTVHGGLWVYDDEYTLEWRAIPGDRSGIVVEEARVTVSLPTTPPLEAVHHAAYGAPYRVEERVGAVAFTVQSGLPDGTAFQVLVGFPKAGISADKQPYQVREEQDELVHRFEALDVNLFIKPDGRVWVEESHRVSVTQGRLTQGERVIPLAYTDGIANVSVFEGEQPLTQSISLCDDCFTVIEANRRADWIRYEEPSDDMRINEGEAGQAIIRWQVPPLVPGEATTFRLRYEVKGLIVRDDSGQRFDWIVLFDTRRVEQQSGERVDLRGTPIIESATLRIHLPPGVSPDAVTLSGGVAETQADGTLLLTYEGPVLPGSSWEIQVRLPPSATDAPTPHWQSALENARAARAAAAARLAQQQLGLGAGGILTLVGGVVGTIVLWLTRGRDRETALQAEYLSEPPSTLPPGIVAYLLEEQPTTKGAMASLFHLAALGILQITYEQGFRVRRNLPDTTLRQGQEIATRAGSTVVIPPHLVTLYNGIATEIPTDKSVWMSSAFGEFVRALPLVYERMGEEASQYFSEIPTKAIFRWKSVGQGLILTGAAGAAIAYVAGRATWGNVVFWIPAALVVVGALLWFVSGQMAQKTTAGAQEAGKWEAFRRYLQNLKQYGDAGEAQKILDDYFAYAVALDVETVVLHQATELGTHPPVWTFPTTVRRDDPPPPDASRPAPRLPTLRTVPGRAELPDGSRPAPIPEAGWSVQGASDSLARAISDADRSLSSLLQRAGGVDDGTTPFDVVRSGVEGASRATFSATQSTFEVIGELLDSASSGGGSGGYSGGESSSRSSSGSRSWSRSSSSSRSSRSRGSRRSGGGGRRGFG